MKITLRKTIFLVIVGLCLFSTAGCVGFNTSSDASATAQEPAVPYYPPNVKDIQVPGELDYRRDNSMFINTSSFAGGVLNFEGRVEVDSLTNFFIMTMEKQGWKHAGSVRSKNVLLAFIKPNKNCMVNISEPGYGMKTQVNIYMSEDMSGGGNVRPDEYVR